MISSSLDSSIHSGARRERDDLVNPVPRQLFLVCCVGKTPFLARRSFCSQTALLVFCIARTSKCVGASQVAEARQRHKAEKEAALHEQELERQQLAEEERQAASERVSLINLQFI